MRSKENTYILGCTGRNNGKTSNGSSGHVRGTRSGHTRKKPKDLSTREREKDEIDPVILMDQ